MSGQDNRASEDLARRVAQLEKQQRRMKWIGFFVLLAIPGTFILLGQTQPNQQTVEASKIIIRDAAGRVRITIGTDPYDATVNLFNRSGALMTTLSSAGAGGAIFFHARPDGTGTTLSGTELSFWGPKGSVRPVSYLNADELGLHNVGGNQFEEHPVAGIHADDQGGTVFVRDAKGFQATMGETELENVTKGGSENTSAASVVLADPKKKVIWQAP